jgi:cytochrome c556
MIKTIFMVIAIAAAPALFADELHEQMEKVGKANGVLRKAVPAKAMAEVSSAAAELAQIFPTTVAAWEKRNMADAVTWTKESAEWAKELKAAADAGHAEHVSAVFSKLSGNCKSCHTAHREKLADGTYKIK